MPEMDMILERVQNKFACIIGELCSEPVVLSKFAIWLDLRLAEYKAKGAISLDCSGESPDPVWLKGHEKPLPVVQRSDDAYSPRNRMRPSMHEKDIQKSRPPESPAYDDEDRLSPGMVVIKEEAADETTDVFPISIHRVQPGSQNLNTRKRSLPDSLAPTQDSFSNLSPSKIRHVDNRLRTCEGVDNQSLMSIIQEAEDDNHSSNVTDSDFSVLMSSNQGTPVPSRGDNSLTFSPQNSSAPLHYSSSPSTSADDSSSVQQMMSFQSTQGELSFSQDSGQSPDWRSPSLTVGGRVYRNTSASASATETTPVGAMVVSSSSMYSKALGALKTFTRWLVQMGYDEARPIETIPSSTLDNYLVEFFSSVKRVNGTEYHPNGLRKIRKYLQHFLKTSGYPDSLTTSRRFEKSQKAFKEKVEKLQQLEKNHEHDD